MITHLFCCLCRWQCDSQWKPDNCPDTDRPKNNPEASSPSHRQPRHHNPPRLLSPLSPLAHLNPETWKGIRCRTVRVNQTPNGHRTSSAGLTLYETQTRGEGIPPRDALLKPIASCDGNKEILNWIPPRLALHTLPLREGTNCETRSVLNWQTPQKFALGQFPSLSVSGKGND